MDHEVLFLKDTRIAERIIVTPSLDDDEGLNGIRCPRCGWRPQASSRWCCECLGSPETPFESCGTSWNTFSTKGRCPGCSHQWRWTSCLLCEQWSLHRDWYEQNEGSR
jgi:DNA-directed RNA polymerase subunit RPC12/RpoP